MVGARRLRYHRGYPIGLNPVKVIQLTIQNRAVALLLTILILVLGVTFLTVGMALLAGLAITGAVIGTGAAVYRRLRGKPDLQLGQQLSERDGLDPALEVQPERPATIAPPTPPDK